MMPVSGATPHGVIVTAGLVSESCSVPLPCPPAPPTHSPLPEEHVYVYAPTAPLGAGANL